MLNVYRPEVEKMDNANIGYTKVTIDGRLEICHYQECNLGNLVTDAMIFSRVMDDLGGIYWTDAAIAFIQGGGK